MDCLCLRPMGRGLLCVDLHSTIVEEEGSALFWMLRFGSVFEHKGPYSLHGFQTGIFTAEDAAARLSKVLGNSLFALCPPTAYKLVGSLCE